MEEYYFKRAAECEEIYRRDDAIARSELKS
jgi:hypothetical protein